MANARGLCWAVSYKGSGSSKGWLPTHSLSRRQALPSDAFQEWLLSARWKQWLHCLVSWEKSMRTVSHSSSVERKSGGTCLLAFYIEVFVSNKIGLQPKSDQTQWACFRIKSTMLFSNISTYVEDSPLKLMWKSDIWSWRRSKRAASGSSCTRHLHHMYSSGKTFNSYQSQSKLTPKSTLGRKAGQYKYWK